MSEPKAKWGSGGSRFSAIVLALGFLVLIGVAGVNTLLVRGARDQNAEVAHTIQVQRQAARVLNMLIDAETGQRGYLLTGKDPYRQRYVSGRDKTPEALVRLSRLTTDNESQQRVIRQMWPLVRAKLGELKQTVTLADQGRTDAAVVIVRTDRGKLLMDQLRVRIAQIQAEEDRLLISRRQSVENGAQTLLLLSIGGLMFAALLAAGAILSIFRYARRTEQASAEVRRLNEGLEEIVAERTADLEAANAEIQRFAYIVSHDLRAPLVNVMGFTSELEAVGRGALDLLERAEAEAPALIAPEHRLAIAEDLPEAIGFIRTSTGKMDRLINAILALSRQGRRTLAPERIDMNALITDIVAAIQQQIEAAGADVDASRLPELVSDRLALEQILSNLIENAVKYLSPGRAGVIRVSGARRGEWVEISVEDNGRGIDEADRERVFDLFRRAGTQDRPGEGIGLANVRALVRRLGGHISLESQLNRGSRFTVTLPRVLKGSGVE